VSGGHTFVDLVAGGGPCHGETCGITIDGTVLCWGKNYQRQIGPNRDISWTEPTAIQGDPGWVDVFIGPNMVCGHAPDGDLHCVGDAEFEIMDYTQTPEPLVPELEAASIVQGQTHACILTPEGEAHCWGSNSYGQLGSQSQSIGWASAVPAWASPGE
jgi:alpha-tubulin suppressor-like RCC1 family protein